MDSAGFKDKFVAFLDVLGFKNMVRDAEAGNARSLADLLQELKKFGSPEIRHQLEKKGRPKVCPTSAFIEPHVDFRLHQFSDSAVVSTEISPAGAITLLTHCWGSAMELMRSGIMCRGYITRGLVFHSESNIIGTGYQRAVEAERNVMAFKREADERGTPFVEVDRVVCDYIRGCHDECIQKLFSRCVKGDGEVTALFPFQRLSHNFVIARAGYTFDPENEKRGNQWMRFGIQKIKERIMESVDKTNSDALRKAEHYIRALNAQLEVCDWTGKLIDRLDAPLFS